MVLGTDFLPAIGASGLLLFIAGLWFGYPLSVRWNREARV
jgi:hypothetical protein